MRGRGVGVCGTETDEKCVGVRTSSHGASPAAAFPYPPLGERTPGYKKNERHSASFVPVQREGAAAGTVGRRRKVTGGTKTSHSTHRDTCHCSPAPCPSPLIHRTRWRCECLGRIPSCSWAIAGSAAGVRGEWGWELPYGPVTNRARSRRPQPPRASLYCGTILLPPDSTARRIGEGLVQNLATREGRKRQQRTLTIRLGSPQKGRNTLMTPPPRPVDRCWASGTPRLKVLCMGLIPVRCGSG